MSAQRPKVLVVDDSKVARSQVRQALQSLELEILEASNGFLASGVVEAHPDCALVLCDVNMPLVGGLELLRKLKSKESTARIPVLMLTTEGHPARVKEARDLGAEGWIIKPFKAELLAATVRQYVERA